MRWDPDGSARVIGPEAPTQPLEAGWAVRPEGEGLTHEREYAIAYFHESSLSFREISEKSKIPHVRLTDPNFRRRAPPEVAPTSPSRVPDRPSPAAPPALRPS